jgi:hypothetical protein
MPLVAHWSVLHFLARLKIKYCFKFCCFFCFIRFATASFFGGKETGSLSPFTKRIISANPNGSLDVDRKLRDCFAAISFCP